MLSFIDVSGGIIVYRGFALTKDALGNIITVVERNLLIPYGTFSVSSTAFEKNACE